nr:site-specific tyrosine recombinase/integron integrase [Candidatus Prometheoarchaeum syntrophicum]QEE17005.1 putative tyrosine recombinase XerC-like protein [Candidatus Prometheoarchaeum syntrophicum]
MKLSETFSDFLIAKEIEEGCSSSTIRAYSYDLKILERELGDPHLNSIKIFHIRKVLKIFFDKKYSKQAIARKIACYKSFFNFCYENELISKNPMKAVKSPKIRPEESLPKFLSQQEVRDILSFLEENKKIPYTSRIRLTIIIRLLYASMARVSEISALKVFDVNFDQNLIKVRGKGNKERYIPIDLQTAKLLRIQIENQSVINKDKSSYLFLNNRGTQLKPRSIQQDIQNLKFLLGYSNDKKLTPHIFRHTGATHLRQNGMDISELQDILGHSSPNTTKIYAKNDLNRLKKSYIHYHPLEISNDGKESF